jgi:hypothetical protein
MALNPFKKTKAGPKSLQQYQQEFNQAMFQLGNLHYTKQRHIKDLDNQINQLMQHATKIDADAAKARDAAKKEVVGTAAKGIPNETAAKA